MNQPRALIMAPTRELAVQIHADAEPLAEATGLKLGLAYGGDGYDKQLKVLEKNAPNADKVTQLDFGTLEKFAQTPVPEELVDKLRAADIETLTPLEALNFLYELKQTLAAAEK